MKYHTIGSIFNLYIGNTRGIIGSYIYLNEEAPTYPTSFRLVLTFNRLAFLIAVFSSYPLYSNKCNESKVPVQLNPGLLDCGPTKSHLPRTSNACSDYYLCDFSAVFLAPVDSRTLAPPPLGAEHPDQRIHSGAWATFGSRFAVFEKNRYPPTISSIVIVESLWEGSAVQGPRYTVGPIRLCYRLFLAKPPSTCDAGCVRMHNRCVLLSQMMATEWFTGMICNNQKRNIISAMVIKHLSDVDEVRIRLV